MPRNAVTKRFKGYGNIDPVAAVMAVRIARSA